MLNKTDIRSSSMQKALRSPLKSKKIRKRKRGIKRAGSVSTKDSEKVTKAKKKLNKKIADRYKIKSKDNKEPEKTVMSHFESIHNLLKQKRKLVILGQNKEIEVLVSIVEKLKTIYDYDDPDLAILGIKPKNDGTKPKIITNFTLRTLTDFSVIMAAELQLMAQE